MKRLLFAFILILGWQAASAQRQITYLSATQETQLRWLGWQSGGYSDVIKIAVPGAGFSSQYPPSVSFGQVNMVENPLVSYQAIYGTHAALPYSYFTGYNFQNVTVYSPDTLVFFYQFFNPLRGIFDLQIRDRGSIYIKDNAFNFNGFKEPTSLWAYNKRADAITLHGLKGSAGQTLDVEITGIGTTFTQASSAYSSRGLAPNELIVNFHNDTSFNSVNGVTVISPTRMVASITIPPGTPAGFYDVALVTTQDGFKHINNGFHVLPGPINAREHIKGRVFNDENRNCVFDGGEPVLAGVIVEATPGNFVAITDSIGRYDITVPSGVYHVTQHTQPGWEPLCPPSGTTLVYLDSTQTTADNVDFGQKARPYRDVSVAAASGNARPGFQLPYSAEVFNSSSTNEAITLRFIPDSSVSILSVSPPANRNEGDTLYWNTSLPKLATARFNVTTLVSADAPLGKQYASRFDLIASQPDDNPGNDSAVVKNDVRGSFDPNDKSVEPEGYITLKDSVLTYLIRFQNTGNDTAFTVLVRDTISKNLDLTSIRTLVASHLFSFKLLPDRTAEWRFESIHLLDSARNEVRSHGFIKFQLKRTKNLPYGTRIANQAHIYFDFNPPVATNIVNNTLVSVRQSLWGRQLVGNAQVVPNPLSGKGRVILTIGEAKGRANMFVKDALGRTVFRQERLSGKEFPIDAKLKPGVYFLQISEGGQQLAQGRFVAE